MIYKVLNYIYLFLFFILFIGMLYYWRAGPIEIAKICALGAFWSLFGVLANTYFKGK